MSFEEKYGKILSCIGWTNFGFACCVQSETIPSDFFWRKHMSHAYEIQRFCDKKKIGIWKFLICGSLWFLQSSPAPPCPDWKYRPRLAPIWAVLPSLVEELSQFRHAWIFRPRLLKNLKMEEIWSKIRPWGYPRGTPGHPGGTPRVPQSSLSCLQSVFLISRTFWIGLGALLWSSRSILNFFWKIWK